MTPARTSYKHGIVHASQVCVENQKSTTTELWKEQSGVRYGTRPLAQGPALLSPHLVFRVPLTTKPKAQVIGAQEIERPRIE